MSIHTSLPHCDLVRAGSNHWDEPERHVEAQQRVQEMSVMLVCAAVHAMCLQTSGHCCCRFAHGYDAYMKYAFPHDELRPLSKTWTDSLGGEQCSRYISKHSWTCCHRQPLLGKGAVLTPLACRRNQDAQPVCRRPRESGWAGRVDQIHRGGPHPNRRHVHPGCHGAGCRL